MAQSGKVIFAKKWSKTCVFAKFFVPLRRNPCNNKNIENMNTTLLKNLGAILVLLGVVCLAVYYFGVQENALLVASMVLEVAGILSYILINRRLG